MSQISQKKNLGLCSKIYFVAAIGTDIGKTFLVENLCKNLPNAMAIKPIASGFCDDDKNSDSAKILKSLSLENSLKNINSISPWRFQDAVSPHFAADIIGKKIDFSEVVKFCLQKITEAKNSDRFLFIEAAGGVMTPINYQKTFLDLAKELEVPVLLVSANYLGSISHTLCAVEAMKMRGIKLEKIILNDGALLPQSQQISISSTLEELSKCDVILMSDLFKKLS
jgi:dethiobiotin synthetase